MRSFHEVHDDLVANFWHWNHFILNLLVRSFNHRLNITLKYNEIMWPWTIFNIIQSQTKVVITKSWVYSICVEKSSLFTLIRPSLNINWFSNLFCFWCQDWKVTCISYNYFQITKHPASSMNTRYRKIIKHNLNLYPIPLKHKLKLNPEYLGNFSLKQMNSLSFFFLLQI